MKQWYAHFWRDSTGTGCLVSVEADNAIQAMHRAERIMSKHFVGWRQIGMYTGEQVSNLVK